MKLDWDCVEFTHTVGWEPRDRDDDEAADASGLVGWCVRRGILDEESGRDFLAHAAENPKQARIALKEARRIRALVHRTLVAVARDGVPGAAELDELNALLRRFVADREVVGEGEDVGWHWSLDPSRLESLMGPVVWSLAELLTSPERRRVKYCDAHDCGWLFLDGSRNRSRRWCDMSDCGNRAKVRRFRARRQAEES